jgi:hypothetical protein
MLSVLTQTQTRLPAVLLAQSRLRRTQGRQPWMQRRRQQEESMRRVLDLQERHAAGARMCFQARGVLDFVLSDIQQLSACMAVAVVTRQCELNPCLLCFYCSLCSLPTLDVQTDAQPGVCSAAEFEGECLL